MKKNWTRKEGDVSKKQKKPKRNFGNQANENFKKRGTDELEKLDKWEHDLFDSNAVNVMKKPVGHYNGKNKKTVKWQPRPNPRNFGEGEDEKISNISTNNSEKLKFLDEESILSLERALQEPKKPLYEFRIMLQEREISITGNKLNDIFQDKEFKQFPPKTEIMLKMKFCKELLGKCRNEEIQQKLDCLHSQYQKLNFPSF